MSVVSFEGLQMASGKQSREDVMRWLKKNNIPCVMDERNMPKTVSDWLPDAVERPSRESK